MSENSPATLPRIHSRRWLFLVAVVSLTVVAVVGGLLVRAHSRSVAVHAHEESTRRAFSPVLERLEAVASRPMSPPRTPARTVAPMASPNYDIDKTIRVIHEIEAALKNSSDLNHYLGYLASHDYDGVAPEILRAQKDVLAVLFKLHAKQVAAEDEHAAWLFTSEVVLSLASVVHGGVGAGVVGAKIDGAQARRLLDDVKRRQGEHHEVLRAIGDLETELLSVMLSYSEIEYRFLKEWDTLCNHRDRAYLAVAGGDWPAAIDASQQAIRLAPHEREAHLLEALALIESAPPPGEREPIASSAVDRLLDDFIAEHPDSNAPAYVLRGAWRASHGLDQEATLDLQQSAIYYPKQADQLLDMADPYRARAFLRKSKEGNYVLDLYKSSMLGAGYFSPDLRLAKLHLDRGRSGEAKGKLLDHFARRRQQQQWDFVLSDITFCNREFGAFMGDILPEDTYLDLVVGTTLFGSKLKVGVRNRSDRLLHNATLLLAIQFTDMHRDDYEPIIAGDTQPILAAEDTTSFGDVPISFSLYGRSKSVKDIVKQRGILITDEGVTWVDADDFKIAAMHDRLVRRSPGATTIADEPPASVIVERLVQPVVDAMRAHATIRVDPALGGVLKDDVVISLPRQAVTLKPVFRLRYGDDVTAPDENQLTADRIRLRFRHVAHLDAKANKQPLTLLVDSVLRPLEMQWVPTDGEFRLQSIH